MDFIEKDGQCFDIFLERIKIGQIIRPLYKVRYEFWPSTVKFTWTQDELDIVMAKLKDLNKGV